MFLKKNQSAPRPCHHQYSENLRDWYTITIDYDVRSGDQETHRIVLRTERSLPVRFLYFTLTTYCYRNKVSVLTCAIKVTVLSLSTVEYTVVNSHDEENLIETFLCSTLLAPTVLLNFDCIVLYCTEPNKTKSFFSLWGRVDSFFLFWWQYSFWPENCMIYSIIP